MTEFKIVAKFKGGTTSTEGEKVSNHFTRNYRQTANDEEHARKIWLGFYSNVSGFIEIKSCKEVKPILRAKNYMVIITTGSKAYSTSVRAYKVVNNRNIFIGEDHGLGEMETKEGYLEKIFKYKLNSKIKIRELYRAGKIYIQEIRL